MLRRAWMLLVGAFQAWMLLVGAFLGGILLAQSCQNGIDPEIEAERARQDSAVAATLQENRNLQQLTAALAESAAVHQDREASHKADADRRAQRIRFLEDSLVQVGALIRPATGGPPVPAPQASQADSAALLGSCLEWYRERTAEVDDLRLALTECDEKASADSTRADTLTVANARLILALSESDSLRRVEIARPRPCTRDLLVARVACWKVDVVIATGSFVGGLTAGR